MTSLDLLLACVCVCAISTAVAAGSEGLVAEWNFDEGQGDVLRDSSGNESHGKIHGATWVKCGDGYALAFDGTQGYVDCGAGASLNIAGPITVEAWVKPLAKGWGGGNLVGRGWRDYKLSFSNRGLAWWYVATGSNGCGAKLALGEWNHVAGTFDGEIRRILINGRILCTSKNAPPAGSDGVSLLLGSKGPPHFNGLLDNVRVYSRALSPKEIAGRFRAEAPQYGYDPEWLRRVKVTPYYYFDRGQIVLEVDYRLRQPLADKSRLDVTLHSQKDETLVLARQVVEPLRGVIEAKIGGWASNPGMMDITLPCGDLKAGVYVIRVALKDDRGACPVERITFNYPPTYQLPSPAEKPVAGLPPPPTPTPFDLDVDKRGGFRLHVNGTVYPFESRISWPNGDFNRLACAEDGGPQGEKSWKVKATSAGAKRHIVEAGGSFYTIRRQIDVFPTHVYVKDTYTNTTDEDLGLLIYNEMPMEDSRRAVTRLAGYEGAGRLVEMPMYGGASVFVADANVGIGMVPMDDVYIIQSVLYAENNVAGMGTQKFALGPKASYTLEWALYPTGSRDYYDFINTFRKVEDRIGTVEGGAHFVSFGPTNRRQVPGRDFVEKRGMKCAIVSCLSRSADNPELDIEGIEFIDFPKEMELLKRQTDALHHMYPDMDVVLHIAHSYYATADPERYADSKLINANGRHVSSGSHKDWRWYFYYPTPGNSFHDAMMRSVDVLMDEIGMDGGFMDGFLLGYGGRWTYDGRWDGHSAEIDLNTKTIKRKLGSVLLLMQPSMIQYARKIHNKGGVVIGNGVVLTRSVADEKYIIFDSECQAGPECHLAPSALALSNPPFQTETEIYLDMLDKLSWGMLYMYYNERVPLTHASLAARQFPITFQEMRSGLVRGPERIVTMNSGVYGWPATQTAGKPGDRRLHRVYKFDARGAEGPHNFITRVDQDSVRTALQFDQNESAVIVPIPVSLEATIPVNVRVLRYEGKTLKILLNGKGEATLDMFVGTSYPDWRDGVFTNGGVSPIDVDLGDAYRVIAGGTTTTIEERDGTLSVPLKLDGQVEVLIERADRGE